MEKVIVTAEYQFFCENYVEKLSSLIENKDFEEADRILKEYEGNSSLTLDSDPNLYVFVFVLRAFYQNTVDKGNFAWNTLVHLLYKIDEKQLPIEQDVFMLLIAAIMQFVVDSEDNQCVKDVSDKCFSLICKKYGNDFDETINSFDSFATILIETGDYEKASELYERSYELSCGELGETHFTTLISLSKWGDALIKQGNYQRAVEINYECYSKELRALGKKILIH